MKINSYQSTPTTNIQFKSLYGELPKEINHLKSDFTKHVNEFMKDNPGYDLVVTTTRNNKKLKMGGNIGLLNSAKTKKPLSEIKSIQDLKDMLSDNYLSIQARGDMLEQVSRMFMIN